MHSAHRRVVRVVRVVDGSMKTRWNGTSEKHGEDVVIQVVALVLVEGEQDKCPVVIEAWIEEKRLQPELEPRGSKVNSS